MRLESTAFALVGAGKGLLAMDESTATCDRRFAALGIDQTEEARRALREASAGAGGPRRLGGPGSKLGSFAL